MFWSLVKILSVTTVSSWWFKASLKWITVIWNKDNRMIPFYPFHQILDFWRMLLIFLRQRWQINETNDSDELYNLIMFIQKLHADYLQLMLKIYPRYLCGVKTKRRKLMKPHLLIKLMKGYHSNLFNSDVWCKLERNWMHFFWLTGETPEPLSILVERIKIKFLHINANGPVSAIDIRNQVSVIHDVQCTRCHCSWHDH